MSIRVELTYDMGKALGTNHFDIEEAPTVGDVLRQARERFRGDREDFERLTRTAALAVNGVLVNHRRGLRTRLQDGDRVTFLKAAAGG